MADLDVIRFKPFLDFIARQEGTADQPAEGYDTTLGYGAFVNGDPTLTEMTLEELEELQGKMLRHPKNNFNSSACGRYQIVRRTLRDLRKNGGLGDDEKFSDTLQDQLCVELIKRRGRDVTGLRNEWASLAAVDATEILRHFDWNGTTDSVGATEDPGKDIEISIASTRRAYLAQELNNASSEDITTLLNDLAREGWALHTMSYSRTRTMLVLERDAARVDSEPEPDEEIPPYLAARLHTALPGDSTADLLAPAESEDDSYRGRFTDFIEEQGLEFFDASEFLFLGNGHSSGSCKGLNSYPPEELWDNIVATAKVLDALRARLGAPITLTSIYRNEAYNDCIGGASGSLHKQFNAADFKCRNGNNPLDWARELQKMRSNGAFSGGIGVYDRFVHIDTRGQNVNFGPRGHLL